MRCSLPVGVRCYGQGDAAEGTGSAGNKRHYGMVTSSGVFREDLEGVQGRHAYPLPSGVFMPARNDAELRQFNVLRVDLNNLLENKEQAQVKSDKPSGIDQSNSRTSMVIHHTATSSI
jgi:hypothetical protein